MRCYILLSNTINLDRNVKIKIKCSLKNSIFIIIWYKIKSITIFTKIEMFFSKGRFLLQFTTFNFYEISFQYYLNLIRIQNSNFCNFYVKISSKFISIKINTKVFLINAAVKIVIYVVKSYRQITSPKLLNSSPKYKTMLKKGQN